MKNDTIKLSELTISELMEYEKACNMLSDYYASSVRRYDGSADPVMKSESKKIIELGAIRKAIIMHIESKLDKLA